MENFPTLWEEGDTEERVARLREQVEMWVSCKNVWDNSNHLNMPAKMWAITSGKCWVPVCLLSSPLPNFILHRASWYNYVVAFTIIITQGNQPVVPKCALPQETLRSLRRVSSFPVLLYFSNLNSLLSPPC